MSVSERTETTSNPVKATDEIIKELPAKEQPEARERQQEVIEEVSSDESEDVTD